MTEPAPTPPVDASQAPAVRNGAAVTVSLGAVLAIVGTFLTWVTVTVGGQSVDASESGLDWSGDAKWVIALAGLALLSVLVEVTGWKILPWLIRTPILDGIIMAVLLVIAAAQTVKTGSFTDAGQTYTYRRHIGAGLWLCLAGAALVLIGGYTLAGGWERVKREARSTLLGVWVRQARDERDQQPR